MSRISKELREQVLERDGRACLKCGRRSWLTMDHIVPIIQGGRDVLENLQVLCKKCNLAKGGTYKGYRIRPIELKIVGKIDLPQPPEKVKVPPLNMSRREMEKKIYYHRKEIDRLREENKVLSEKLSNLPWIVKKLFRL